MTTPPWRRSSSLAERGPSMLGYLIDRAGGLIVLAWRGNITVAEVLHVQERLRADPDSDPGYAVLSDYREAGLLDFSAGDLRRIAANAPFGVTSRRAILVSRDAN